MPTYQELIWVGKHISLWRVTLPTDIQISLPFNTESRIEHFVRTAWLERSRVSVELKGEHDCYLISLTVGHMGSECCD